MKVALINAHTSYSKGASSSFGTWNFNEYDLSCSINTYVHDKLSTNGIDSFIVDGSKVKPYSKSLSYKAFFTNVEAADLAIETHFNSSSIFATKVRGFEVLYDSKRTDSKYFAECLVSSLYDYLPFIKRRGNGLYERTKIYILKSIDCPIIILEICFLSNPNDRLFLLQPRAIEVIGNSIYAGISAFKEMSDVTKHTK